MYVFPITVAMKVKYNNEFLDKKRNDHQLTLPQFSIYLIIADPHGEKHYTSCDLGDFR